MLFEGFIYVQLIGFLAFFLMVSSYQLRSQRALFFGLAFADMFWVIHYLLLGALVPALVIAVAISRTVLAVFLLPQYKGIIVLCAVTAAVIISLLNYNNYWPNLLPAASAVVYGLATHFNGDYLKSRILLAAGAVLWIVVGAVFHSYAEVVNSFFGLISIIIGMRRHRRKAPHITLSG